MLLNLFQFMFYMCQWSFGILLWEIFTFGSEPYTGLPNTEIEKYLTGGKRLCQPDVAPDYL